MEPFSWCLHRGEMKRDQREKAQYSPSVEFSILVSDAHSQKEWVAHRGLGAPSEIHVVLVTV